MCLPRERIMKLKGYIALADDKDRNLSYLDTKKPGNKFPFGK